MEVFGPNWVQLSSRVDVTPGYYKFVGDVPNVIEFWVESKRADSVERFKITANMFNEKREKPVIERFVKLTKLLFSRLNLAMPDDLLGAINGRKKEIFKMDYGNIFVNYETYKIGHGLEVEVSEISSLK